MSKLSVSVSTYPLQSVPNQQVRLVMPHSVTHPFFNTDRLHIFCHNVLCSLLIALMLLGLAYFSVWMRSTVQPTYFISCWKAAANN